MDDNNTIKPGDHVIVHREGYGVKIHKIPGNPQSNNVCSLGRDSIALNNIVGHKYWSTFQMIRSGKERSYIVEKRQTVATCVDEILKGSACGLDNRNINDNGCSQKLTKDEIINLREQGLSSQHIVSTIIQNSSSFSQKTEFSQVKYLKKKENKYCEYITIRKPTMPVIAQIILSNQKRMDMLGLRIDTFAQLNTLACVRSGGVYLVYEDYCSNLITAKVLCALGNEGTVISAFNGDNIPSPNALHYMNLPQERMSQVLSIRIQNLVNFSVQDAANQVCSDSVDISQRKRTASDVDEDSSVRKRARWEENQEKIFEILHHRAVDGLLIVGRDHPANILRALLNYLGHSRSFVVFSPVREPLQEMFDELRQRNDVVALKLTESWLRSYQVLPERTHPDVNMSSSSGFLFSGIKVNPMI